MGVQALTWYLSCIKFATNQYFELSECQYQLLQFLSLNKVERFVVSIRFKDITSCTKVFLNSFYLTDNQMVEFLRNTYKDVLIVFSVGI